MFCREALCEQEYRVALSVWVAEGFNVSKNESSTVLQSITTVRTDFYKKDPLSKPITFGFQACFRDMIQKSHLTWCHAWPSLLQNQYVHRSSYLQVNTTRSENLFAMFTKWVDNQLVGSSKRGHVVKVFPSCFACSTFASHPKPSGRNRRSPGFVFNLIGALGTWRPSISWRSSLSPLLLGRANGIRRQVVTYMILKDPYSTPSSRILLTNSYSAFCLCFLLWARSSFLSGRYCFCH